MRILQARVFNKLGQAFMVSIIVSLKDCVAWVTLSISPTYEYIVFADAWKICPDGEHYGPGGRVQRFSLEPGEQVEIAREYLTWIK